MNVASTLNTLLLLTLLLLCNPTVSGAFAGINNGGGASSQQPAFMLSDRFKATCPAELGSIYEFDPNLVQRISSDDNENDESNDVTWVAVFRSSNNLPSVLIKDDFLNAMRIATTVQTDAATTSNKPNDKIEVSSSESSAGGPTTTDENGTITTTTGVKTPKPVAIAKLSPSTIIPNRWIIESMRCNLKKEDTDSTCDGQSEHTEALSICIDELILHHLNSGRGFNGAIRTKATLVSGILLEERGFEEVTELRKDMATHVSCLDGSMERYAERVVTTAAKSSGSRDRALEILSCLGRLDRVEEEERFQEDDDSDEDDEIDPWAALKQFV